MSEAQTDADAELISRCLEQGDAGYEAFRELLKRYEAMVYATSIRIVGDRHEAEEVCQDTFLKVHQKLSTFEGRSSFKTWLFRINYNLCISRRRKLAKKNLHTEFEEDAVSGDAVNSFNADQKRAATKESVDVTLSNLSESDKEILTLRFITGLSLNEIADVLDLSLSAAKMRLYRAMNSFKKEHTSPTSQSNQGEK